MKQTIQSKLRKWNIGILLFVFNLRDMEIVTRRWDIQNFFFLWIASYLFRSQDGFSLIGTTCANPTTTVAVAPTWTRSSTSRSARSDVLAWCSLEPRPGARGWDGEVTVTRRGRDSSTTSSHRGVSSLEPVPVSEKKKITLKQERDVLKLANIKSRF